MSKKLPELLLPAGNVENFRAAIEGGADAIYLGLRQTPEMIVSAAVQEDADVVALSVLSGAHMTIFTKVKKLMDDEGLVNVLLTGGGIIPKEDMQTLSKLGVGKMFGPGTTVDSTIEYIENWVNDNRN
jgi:methylmalonyl-CoA mutase C-terminal domain/subunit